MVSLLRFFSIFLVLLLASPSYSSVLLDRVVAIVNQEVITWSELYKAMEADASPQFKELKEEDRKKLFKENEPAFLETLINVKLQLQEAKSMGFSVSEDEVKEAIENIMKKFTMTEEAFKDSLKKEGFTFEEYKKRLKEQILMSKIVNQQVRSKVVVTDADVKKFINENGELVERDEGYRISQILFNKPKTDAGKAEIEEKAEAVLKKLAAGMDFKELATEYSEAPRGNAGGEVGFIRKGHLMKEFADVLSGMKPGDTSRPFWSPRGLHIIRLDEKVEAKSEKEVGEEARKILTSKIIDSRYTAWIKALREKSFIEIRL